MRVVIALGILSGCYAPSAPAGAPCDPTVGNCPGDQVCRAESGGFFCGDPGGPQADAAIDGAIDAMPDGPSPVMHLMYPATVAECIDPGVPSPSHCKTVNGAQQLVLDIKDSATLNPWQSYVRFDLDGAIAGKTILKVGLRVVATDNGKAPGMNSGEVWNVQPFTLASLDMTTPAKIGMLPLAGSQGAVAKLQPITWPIPINVVAPNSGVFFGLITTASDGVNYWNLAGVDPPLLLIDAQ